MKNFITLFLVLSFAPPVISQQKQASEIMYSFKEAHVEQCKEQKPKVEKTYSFRSSAGKPVLKSYGSRSWLDRFKKVMPFWLSMDGKARREDKNGASEDLQVLLSRYGHIPAIGESARSERLRDEAEKKLILPQEDAERIWQEWLALNPNASASEKGKAEIRVKGLNFAKASRFDWRDHGVELSEVGMQGECNSCWAFASVDAMQAARQVAAIRSKNEWNDPRIPTHQVVFQLMSCMSRNGDPCLIGWHGEAFSFMVDKGLPLGSFGYYAANQSPWGCNASNYVKALTWDYVLPGAPQKVAPVEDIKRAIVQYGPVVSAMKFDNCFWLYGSGVFNEEQNQDGGHLVLIFGWDDAKGAWLIKNSYGTNWGEGGFAWIKYGSNNIGQFAAWIAPDPKAEERLAKELQGEL